MKITNELVESLIADQFPDWADLPVSEVVPNGWDNRTFRLGDEMSVRLPSAERYVAQVRKEHLWLPYLAEKLPTPIPGPIAIGKPGFGYQWEWSIYGWIEGEVSSTARIDDMTEFAVSLGEFLVALQAVDATGGPVAGAHNFHRGGDLSVYDGETRQAIDVLGSSSSIDLVLAREVWELALSSSWDEAPVWIHGDVSSGNLLVRDGKLAGVIDFGGTAIGDPACDLAIAWTMFDGESRDVFREVVNLDEQTWERARGWVLWKALIVLSGLSETNAAESARYEETVGTLLSDHTLRNRR